MGQELAPRFSVLPLGVVRPTGWILEQLNRDLKDGFASRLDELTDHASNDLFKHRIDTSKDHFAWWDSETRGNWLWGYTMMAYLSADAASRARIDGLVADLKATQDPDGYIGIYSESDRYNHPQGENGELWSQSRALLIFLAYYELTRDEIYLKAAEDAAQLTMRHYGPGRSYFRADDSGVIAAAGGLFHGLCYVDVMEWLYHLTGNTRYRDFGVWLYQDFNAIPTRTLNDDMKLGHLLEYSLPFTGHAAHTAEHFRALLWAYLMTGDPAMKQAIETAITKLRLYSVPSGALIGDESIHGLPMPDMGYEYCAMTELMWSLSSALQKFGDSVYADWIENLTFNAAQGARFPDGSGICYLSTENRLEAVASRPDSYSFWHRYGRFKYSPTHEDIAVCCNPNAVRLMPHYVNQMWMRLNDRLGVAAMTYGPSTLTTEINGVSVTIEQETRYPFSEAVTLTITPVSEVEFVLYLRKPGWSVDTAVAVEGADISEDDGFVVLSKKWSPGDTVRLTFTARIEPVLNPNGEYSVRRGPLQYAMPIPHEEHPIKSYPVPSFHDYNLTPQDLSQAYHVLFLDEAQPDLGLAYRVNPRVNWDRPWDAPPAELVADSISLVPLGCAVLRRSTFPMKRATPAVGGG
jgi:hypothetical protein